MELIKQYFDIQRQIYEHFGYEPDWRTLPLSDETHSVWGITDDCVYYADSLEHFADGNYYGGEMYRSDIMTDAAKEYVMLSVDTQSDGNVYLVVLTAANQLDQETLDELIDPYYDEDEE